SAPERIQAACVRARSAASTCTARHCCQTIAAASVAISVTMIMAVSSAAPRWRLLMTAMCRFMAMTSGPEQDVANQTAVPAAARCEAQHQSHALGQGLAGGGGTHAARRRRCRGGDIAGRLAVAPRVALIEVDLPLRQPGQRAQLAGLAALQLQAAHPAVG